MLNVFLNIDTEVYPLSADWRAERLRSDMQRDIYDSRRKGSSACGISSTFSVGTS
jgi:hypothetical protein